MKRGNMWDGNCRIMITVMIPWSPSRPRLSFFFSLWPPPHTLQTPSLTHRTTRSPTTGSPAFSAIPKKLLSSSSHVVHSAQSPISIFVCLRWRRIMLGTTPTLRSLVAISVLSPTCTRNQVCSVQDTGELLGPVCSRSPRKSTCL